MKVLQKILFTCSFVFGITFAVSAQKDGDRKPPPKDPPPVINPQPKNPPPKQEPTPKKPGGMAIWKNETGYTA
ncbi:MAG TPA: hypothetical protein VHQ01_05000 [Pyrinomonadaceae bacterium]|jgi:hypothetical protein|nr:hypothetical protein [Pyrinomonadaceae bacterium]